jgi:hypothetical protein
VEEITAGDKKEASKKLKGLTGIPATDNRKKR